MCATSTFFNNYARTLEQQTLEDLIVESIQIYGLDMVYLPRIQVTYDDLYGASEISVFRDALQIEMYVSSFEGFEGEGTFAAKFGIEIRDQVTFTIARRAFERHIGPAMNFIRPREGDLIYYPLNNKVFKITYVQDKAVHYPLGFLPTFQVHCDLYEYSNEHFDTGIPEIDAIQVRFSTNIFDHAILTDEGAPLITCAEAKYGTGSIAKVIVQSDFVYEENAIPSDNDYLQEQADDIIDFTPDDPYGEIES